MFYNWRIKSSKNFPRNHAVPGLFFKNCSRNESDNFLGKSYVKNFTLDYLTHPYQFLQGQLLLSLVIWQVCLSKRNFQEMKAFVVCIMYTPCVFFKALSLEIDIQWAVLWVHFALFIHKIDTITWLNHKIIFFVFFVPDID